jgi:diguanylate cyclase
MSELTTNVDVNNPAELARETLRRLALSRIIPTPDNYRNLYHEIAGIPVTAGAVTALEILTDDLRQQHPALSPYLDEMEKTIKEENWPRCAKILAELSTNSLFPVGGSAIPETATVTDHSLDLRNLMCIMLEEALAPGLKQLPELEREAHRIADKIKQTHREPLHESVGRDIKRLCVDIEMQSANSVDQQGKLRGLLHLLLDNMSELMDDDSWLHGQLEMIKEVIQGPARPQMYDEAEKRLKDVIYKQGLVKSNLREATRTLRSTMKTFVDRLGETVEATGDYQEKISGYAERISNTEDVLEMSNILEHILRETRMVQASTSRTHEELKKNQEAALNAERRIGELEADLTHMSTLVRIDPMTQSLNRRGMEHEFQKESSRSDRHGSPLCAAMIDIDDFKKLNDTYGHMTGDELLVHLVQVAKEELRVTDVIGRMGGEEFLILLPNTYMDDAISTVTRVQRGLTKRLFLNNNDRILITFSAGVALRECGESQESVMDRADKGLYEAKRTGKNKVCKAPPLSHPEKTVAA